MKTLKTTLAAIFSAAVLGISLTACGSSAPAQSHEDRLDACLYSAMSEYPTLPAGKVALDVAPGCESLPASDRQQLRDLVSQFMQAAQRKSG